MKEPVLDRMLADEVIQQMIASDDIRVDFSFSFPKGFLRPPLLRQPKAQETRISSRNACGSRHFQSKNQQDETTDCYEPAKDEIYKRVVTTRLG